MTSSFKRKLSIGVAVTALACLAGGGAYAATQSSSSASPTSDPQQAFLNDVAGRLHVSAADLQAALKGAAADQIDAAAKAGKLTQAQADAIKKKIQQGAGVPFAGPFLGPPRPFAPGAKPFAPGAKQLAPGAKPFAPGAKPFARGAKRFGGPLARPFPGPPSGPLGFGAMGLIKPGLDAAAKYLGLTDAQIRKQLAAGKSLAGVAKAQNKDVSGLTSAIKAAVKTQLDSAVSAKKLTQAQEQKILTLANSMLDRIVNGKLPAGRPGLFHPRFRPGG